MSSAVYCTLQKTVKSHIKSDMTHIFYSLPPPDIYGCRADEDGDWVTGTRLLKKLRAVRQTLSSHPRSKPS